MPEEPLTRLRRLRARARDLQRRIQDDLRPFLREPHDRGFQRTPSLSLDDEISITTTCTCLMSLALTGSTEAVFGPSPNGQSEIVATIFAALMSAPWMSSGLPENNAFTTALMIRLYGFLKEAKTSLVDLKAWEPHVRVKDLASLKAEIENKRAKCFAFDFLKPRFLTEVTDGKAFERELERLIKSTALDPKNPRGSGGDATGQYAVQQQNRKCLHRNCPAGLEPIESKSIEDIAKEIGRSANNFRIGNYPPSAAVVYWFLDGVTRAQISLQPETVAELCRFAAREFYRQRSLVLAKQAAMMDPIAMAMAACLCEKLRRTEKSNPNTEELPLPTRPELEHAIVELFREKGDAGVWPKYFPLFHYEEAGSNFCFSFELLEAVLAEFCGETGALLDNDVVLAGLEQSVRWCEENRVTCQRGDRNFAGWNSGGVIRSLERGEPESWATAAIHMFLWELDQSLSRRVQRQLLDQYGAQVTKKGRAFEKFRDADLQLGSVRTSLKKTVKTHFIECRNDGGQMNPARSALLFGPPGTSKTTIAKEIAKGLGWPLIEITPASFLARGYQSLFIEAERIFTDLMDLKEVIVLFDEMDALVTAREGAAGVEATFLTTYMLPKLTALHDKPEDIVFIMATNHHEKWDPAIKREGRFDLLLCVGPPTIGEKRKWFEEKDLGGWEDLKSENRFKLELFTYGEFERLLIRAAEAGLAEDLNEIVEESAETVALRVDGLQQPFKKVKSIGASDCVSAAAIESYAPTEKSSPAWRYLRDRHYSKIQYREQRS